MKLDSKYLILLTVGCAVIALDQLTKIYIHGNFTLGESIPVIPDFFNITYVRNTGAAFGFLKDAAESFRKIFFLSMPPIAVIVILRMLKDVANDDRPQILALSLIFGGAIGNYIDRLRFGFVVDFLDFHYKETWSYPAFNVADSAIVTGVGLLLLLMAVTNPKTDKKA